MAVLLSPVGGVAGQFFDNNGNPLSGGKMYSYVAGTTTPQVTYTSGSGATAHSNPIVLDSGGRVPGGEIWLTDGFQYKFVLKTSTDVLIGTYDNIVGINSNFINFLTETEVQTATASQTVFTLATTSYQPGTNTLSVFVDGVNQYDGVTYAYVETSSTVVTFTAGLHVGALVKFTTAQTLSSGVTDASIVTYQPAGTGAVATTVQTKLRESVSVKDFGAVGDGVTDDTAAIKAAINFAQGGRVLFPLGNYIISSPLDVGTNGYQLRLIGASSAFASHSVLNPTFNYSNDFSTASINDYSTLGKRYSAIQCNGCNLVGQADTTVVNPCTTAKEISNLFIYGTNAALVGIYVTSTDCLISDCNVSLFKNFGLLIRAGITTTYNKTSFTDNGWGLAASGTAVYPNTYYSGCQILVLSNIIPNDYTTLSGGTRATTQQFRDIYMNVRGWMVQNLSGYLGIQCSGALGFSFDGIGSYSGNFFYLSTANINGLYVENYSYNGLTTSTQDPHGVYSLASTLQIGSNSVSNNTQTAIVPPIFVDPSFLLYGSAVSNLGYGNVIQNGFTGSQYNTNVTVGVTGGGVNTYTVFTNAIPDTVGFHGFITLSIQKISDISSYSTAVYVASKHTTSTPTQMIPASSQLQVYNSTIGIYAITITNVNFASNGGITFTINWGSGYGSTESFIVDIGLLGGQTNSYQTSYP